MARGDIARMIADAAGPAVRVVDQADGWPSILSVDVLGTPTKVAAFLGPVHSMARQRHERRFQNPGNKRPIMISSGIQPMLLGWSEEFGSPILVSADAYKRVGKGTRFSVLHPASLLEQATRDGWASYFNSTDEEIVALWPAFLPVELARRAEGLSLPDSRVVPLTQSAERTANSAGAIAATQQRQRELASRLIRDGRFSKLVLEPYGCRCAVTGVGLGTVVGAHIYPASAPSSQDIVSNGIALTDTIHRIFDAHRLFIDPRSFRIKIHPTLLAAAKADSRDSALLRLFRKRIALPASREHRPDPMMLEKRYEYFQGQYAWAS